MKRVIFEAMVAWTLSASCSLCLKTITFYLDIPASSSEKQHSSVAERWHYKNPAMMASITSLYALEAGSRS